MKRTKSLSRKIINRTIKEKHVIRTDYLKKVYYVDKFTLMVNAAAKKARAFRKKHPFDAIAFTGTSGAALAYPLSYKLKIPLICVRKSVSDNHFGYLIEGCMTADRYLIVDDFIDTGRTINKINNTIKKDITDVKVAGILLYASKSGLVNWKNIPVVEL